MEKKHLEIEEQDLSPKETELQALGEEKEEEACLSQKCLIKKEINSELEDGYVEILCASQICSTSLGESATELIDCVPVVLSLNGEEQKNEDNKKTENFLQQFEFLNAAADIKDEKDNIMEVAGDETEAKSENWLSLEDSDIEEAIAIIEDKERFADIISLLEDEATVNIGNILNINDYTDNLNVCMCEGENTERLLQRDCKEALNGKCKSCVACSLSVDVKTKENPEIRSKDNGEEQREPINDNDHIDAKESHVRALEMRKVKKRVRKRNPSTEKSSTNEKERRKKTKGPFRCEICDKTFRGAPQLENHGRVHTREKPFLCSVCNRGFAQTGTLSRHMLMHSKTRPLTCDCGKAFRDITYYNMHMRLHSADKPFKCSECEMAFTRKEYLNDHMKRHGSEPTFACIHCERRFYTSSERSHHRISAHKNVATSS